VRRRLLLFSKCATALTRRRYRHARHQRTGGIAAARARDSPLLDGMALTNVLTLRSTVARSRAAITVAESTPDFAMHRWPAVYRAAIESV